MWQPVRADQLEAQRASRMRRLLSSFQSSLEEITIIARPTDDRGLDAVTKALQLQSYNDPSRCAVPVYCHKLGGS